ncbi:AraC family transcriptional regulator [Anderseniella sp. Alg231-50]|uniref:AraC family transcriptional regulator n=1 Tax=Anderseniella sp. Alg231-50 TaxID=1922226 RepID=UPI00307C0D44
MSTITSRSTNPVDYQNLPQPIVVMAKSFSDGFSIPPHQHERVQLLYAINGVMRLRTKRDAWVVPPDGAAYIPAGISHSVSMHGAVDMRTLYIDPLAIRTRPQKLSVMTVPGLLKELILALGEEPVAYGPDSRGSLIAKLIEQEIDRAQALSLHVPLPRDIRLQKVCAELLADPSDRRTLDGWSAVCGASARTLARLFERDLGMSFIQWRQRVRFQSALESLSQGVPVSVVAKLHGYRSPSAFTAAFGKAMGQAPSKVVAQTES